MPTVAVAPTETTIATLDVSAKRRVQLQVVNLDAAQTFVGTLYTRTLYESEWAPSPFPDFSSVGPLASVAPVLDLEGIAAVELRGYMSGAGGDVRVSWS